MDIGSDLLQWASAVRRAHLLGLTAIAGVLVFASLVVAALLISRDPSSVEDELMADLRTSQEQLDFKIIVPSYLPQGTSHSTIGFTDDTGEILDFYLVALEGGNYEPYQRANIHIKETGLNTRPDDPGIEEQVADQTVYVKRFEETVGMGFFADLGGVRTVMEIMWTPDDGDAQLTPAMEDEAYNVFRSMIENSHS